MRRIILYSLLLIIGAAIFYSIRYYDFLGIRQYYYISACDKPISYNIGSIDSRFGLTRSDVLGSVEQSSAIWNNGLGKQLFTYDPQAVLTINMVYDRRQSLNTAINQLEDDLKTGKTTLESEEKKFEMLAQDFDKRLAEYNKLVAYWNAQGGAPKEEYDKLTTDQQSLNAEAARLNAMARELNISTDQYNIQVGKFNQTIRSFKNELAIKPEEGVYNANEERIEIYFNNNRDELVRTIAHELGHARGLEHVPNERAIMYPSTTEYLNPVAEEISQLTEICRDRPFYEPMIENVFENIREFRSSDKK